MITKKRKIIITGIVLFVCGTFVASVCTFLLRKEKEVLLTTGEATVGMVTRTYSVRSRFFGGNDPYVINYSFFIDDTILDGTCSLPYGEKEQFTKAVVGGTYRVKYNPDKPNKKSRIYIDEPVSVSDKEYEELLERWFVMREKVEKSKTWWKIF